MKPRYAHFAFPAILLLLLSLGFTLSGCHNWNSLTPVPPTAVPTTASTTVPGDPSAWFGVYFSEPKSSAVETLRGGPDADLAEAIRSARASVDVAAYDLNLWSIRNALLDAHRQGTVVRMVIESDNFDEPEIQELLEAGISILGDRREGLMHNKFVIIDRYEVWTGSMNFTVNDAYYNNNHLICIRQPRLAENYLTEFEEMFSEDQFGKAGQNPTPYPHLSIDGTRVDSYFSPDDGTAAELMKLIQSAGQSIYFLAYSFTSDDIAAALIERADQGVMVAGVFEENQVLSNTGDEYENLRSAGLVVRLDGNPRNMHHKFMVIDEQIVVAGSYNFSANAEKQNDENTIIFYNPVIAEQFLSEFQMVFAEAQP